MMNVTCYHTSDFTKNIKFIEHNLQDLMDVINSLKLRENDERKYFKYLMPSFFLKLDSRCRSFTRMNEDKK